MLTKGENIFHEMKRRLEGPDTYTMGPHTCPRIYGRITTERTPMDLSEELIILFYRLEEIHRRFHAGDA